MWNRRYRPLFKKTQINVDPEYLKKKNNALLILQALRKMYPDESDAIKQSIEKLSTEFRKAYPELNNEFPIN